MKKILKTLVGLSILAVGVNNVWADASDCADHLDITPGGSLPVDETLTLADGESRWFKYYPASYSGSNLDIVTCHPETTIDSNIKVYLAPGCANIVGFDIDVDGQCNGNLANLQCADYTYFAPLTYYIEVYAADGIGGDVRVTIEECRSAATEDLPTAFELKGNYPNPFNPTTTFEFSIPETGFAELSVYNLAGVKVATPVDGFVAAGEHQIAFDASDLASGVYMYALEYNGMLKSGKMVLVK